MMKVAIVTDSTAYIPAEISKEYAIYSVPLQVIWGADTYRDGIDITPDQFYARLAETKKSCQPPLSPRPRHSKIFTSS